ncbi:histidinol-phosphate transaminase [Alkaliphilus metalliredigens]|uniref:histidinol-phosphate transaminase n=1 Tax=Alkaliphilus metalliredigens TaxID=208226 RepID=UPI0002E858EF|nr:histidinol-phosphate transaminase [Alkaliphilus metalliredigens]
MVRKSIEKLQPYEPNEIYCDIKLDANENNGATMLWNEKIAKALMGLQINQYPDTNAEEIKGILGRQLGVQKDQLVIGCGSDQLITMLFNAFVDSKDRILTLSPTFSMYRVACDIAGGITVEAPLGKDFEFDYFTFIKAVKKVEPKMIFLTNPNNPTGGVISREHIIKIIENTTAVVVVDEAYYEFYGETVADLVNYYSNLIVLRTLSKGYGLAGARIGYSISNKTVTRVLKKVKPPYNVSSLDQIAAKVCLENKVLLQESLREVIEERENLIAALESVDEIKTFKTKGNFVLIEVEEAKLLFNYLTETGIAVRYFGGQGPLKNCIRISVGTKEENRVLMKAVKGYFIKKTESLASGVSA